MGAWIETVTTEYLRRKSGVAPYVGAWIETTFGSARFVFHKVAPYVGAWIETRLSSEHVKEILSHPMWVRGLKLEKKVRYTKVYGRTLCGCVD